MLSDTIPGRDSDTRKGIVALDGGRLLNFSECSIIELQQETRRINHMFNWALTFFIVALIAALFGFGGLAGAAAGIGKFIFVAAVVLLVISLVSGGLRRI
jgi:uncharacterized membrane protein YtjA (UPF0391 family)